MPRLSKLTLFLSVFCCQFSALALDSKEKRTRQLFEILESTHYAELEQVAPIVERGVDFKQRSMRGLTLGRVSLSNEDNGLKITAFLLRKGLKLDATDQLFYGIRRSNLADVQSALRRGANPNAQDRDRWTMLMWAASDARIPIVRALLRGGASTRYRLFFQTDLSAREVVFHYATKERKTDYLETLSLLERAEKMEAFGISR